MTQPNEDVRLSQKVDGFCQTKSAKQESEEALLRKNRETAKSKQQKKELAKKL